MKKRKNINEAALDRIKDIYYRYTESSDCAQIGNIEEVLQTDRQLHSFINRNVKKDRFCEAEELVASYANSTEMQGFIYGFSCAMKLMANSL